MSKNIVRVIVDATGEIKDVLSNSEDLDVSIIYRSLNGNMDETIDDLKSALKSVPFTEEDYVAEELTDEQENDKYIKDAYDVKNDECVYIKCIRRFILNGTELLSPGEYYAIVDDPTPEDGVYKVSSNLGAMLMFDEDAYFKFFDPNEIRTSDEFDENGNLINGNDDDDNGTEDSDDDDDYDDPEELN